MNPRTLIVLALVFTATARAAAPAAESGLARRYAEVRSRIEALFQHRDTPSPELSVLDNPFLVGPPGDALLSTVSGLTSESPTAAVTPTFSRLQQIAATLRITGLVRIGGVSQIVVNSTPRKVGEVISVMSQGSPVFIRLTAFEPGLVTFALDGESVTIRY